MIDLDEIATVICGVCQFRGPLDDFCQTATGPLPTGTYQCPKCRRAWRVVKGKFTLTHWGSIISERNTVVPEQSSL